MITKGIIIAVNDNKYDVHIPHFDSAGVSSRYIVSATLCYQPGNYNSYKVDDIVYVSFERNNISQPVIIGKLYLGKEKEASNANFINSLEVVGKAILPQDTTIGDLQLIDLINNIKAFEYLKGLSSNLPIITICKNPVQNMYGYAEEGFNYDEQNTVESYLITYNNSSNLDVGTVQKYMKYMTGRDDIPVIDNIDGIKEFRGAFLFTDCRIYYPKYENGKLYLIGVQTSHFTTEAEVRRMIEEYNPGITYDDVTSGSLLREQRMGMDVMDSSNQAYNTESENVVVEDITKEAD